MNDHYWNRDTVVKKIQSVFPGTDVAQILSQLESEHLICGYRTCLAIIKLCDEGKGLADLSHYVETAKRDPRDVVAWAESPNEMRQLSWSEPDRKEVQKVDKEQYLRWIEQDRKEKG